MGKVVISSRPIKTAQRIDFNGNIIDPRTKRIIESREVEMTPIPPTLPATPEAQIAPITSQTPVSDGLSVLDEIEATKRKLAQLEEAKRKKIEETEKLLNELKK